MIKVLNELSNFYKKAGNKTQLIIKSGFILYFSLIIIGIFTHFAVGHPLHYELLLITEDLFHAAKSVAIISFIGVILFNNIEKGMADK